MDITRWGTDRQQLRLCCFNPVHALAFLAGVLTLYRLPVLPDLPWILVLLIGVLIVLMLKKGQGLIFLCMMGFLFAYWVSMQRMDGKWPESRHGEDIWMAGYIHDLPQQRGRSWRFLFRSVDQQGLIRVAWYEQSAKPRSGQCWRFKLRMRTPRGSMNPGGQDYEGWLFRNNILATAYVREASPCGQSTQIIALINAWREEASDELLAALQGHPMHAVISALVFGDRRGFSQEDWSVLRHTGTSHLMAISGLHIGLVAGWAYMFGWCIWKAICKYLPNVRAQQISIIFSVFVTLFYFSISGMGLPAQRALIMLIALYMALWSQRYISSWGILALALLFVLLIDLYAVGSAGFWLSFGAVAWILYFFNARLQKPGRVASLIWMQALLGIALLPLCLFWFGEASIASPIVNLALVPLFGLLIPLLMFNVLLLISGVPGMEYTLQFMADTLQGIWVVLYEIDAMAPVMTQNQTPGVWGTGLCIAGLIWIFMPRGWVARPLGLVICLPLLLGISAPKTEPRLTVLDVGQGLSVVFEQGDNVLVFDAGPAYASGFDAGIMVVIPYLKSRGHRHIDVLIQSHGDLDHRGGMPAIQNEFSVGRTFGLDPAFPCFSDESWSWPRVNFEFLHPDSSDWQGNDGSCVLKITLKNSQILLTGDIERTAEKALARARAGDLPSDILVVPHHGSNSSSTQAFLETVDPDMALVSAGWRNRWGFPRKEVRERYQALGVKMYNTADDGALSLVFNNEGQFAGIGGWRNTGKRIWHD